MLENLRVSTIEMAGRENMGMSQQDMLGDFFPTDSLSHFCLQDQK